MRRAAAARGKDVQPFDKEIQGRGRVADGIYYYTCRSCRDDYILHVEPQPFQLV